MSFAHPAALVCALVLPWLWWAGTGPRSRVSRARTAWRMVTVAALVLAASGVRLITGAAPLTVMAVLDRSASVPLRSQQRAVARIDAIAGTMHSQDRLGVATFAGDAAMEFRPRHPAALATIKTSLDDSATNIASGLRLARTALADTGTRRLLLVSDGQETSGYAEREALEARAAGIPIDILLPDQRNVTEPMRVSRVIAPADVATGEPYVVSVEVAAAPGARGDVAIYRDEQLMTTAHLTIGSDGTGSVATADRQAESRPYVYRASIVGADGFEEDGATGTVVTVAGAPRVLYVSAAAAGALREPLAAAGFAVAHVLPGDVPRSRATLDAYAAVVLDDVGADDLSLASMSTLRAYVEESGGGLLLLGNARTLTLDGFPASPLDAVMPIDLRPRTGERATSVALVVVFDKSGSMADVSNGISKIEIARQAVMRVAEVMPPADAVGVVSFDSRAVPVMPLATGTARDSLAANLEAVSPGGSTTIAPAIELASQWLHAGVAANAARRQILLLSDGRTSDQDAARLHALVAAQRDVALSVVAIGPNANRALLEPLAVASGGRAYFPENVHDLPRLVAREAARSSGGGIVEEAFVPRTSSHPVLDGIDGASLPALGGYVVSAAKPTTTTILASHLGDPILSSGRAGLGRVAVFTADLNGRWGTPLRVWRESSRLWAQTVRWLSRRGSDVGLRVSIKDTPDGTRIEVASDRPDGAAADLESVRAAVRTPGGGQQSDIALSAIAPGWFEGRLIAPETGAYAVALTARDRRTGEERRVVRTVYRSANLEHRQQGINVPLLTKLAAVTGGRVLGERDSPFTGSRPRGHADAGPLALILGLAMFVADLIAGRRVRRPAASWWHRATARRRDRLAA